MTTLARNDRHVLRSRLRLSADAPKQTTVFNIEEALRLCSLPGENEGRAYYFRNLSVVVPPDADRFTWLNVFQSRLTELAREATYGRHGRAADVDAVYFLNEQEACEVLLRSVVQRRSLEAWFWPAVSGASPGESPSSHVRSTIEKLSRSEASWVAVAATVLAVDQPVIILSLLPDATVRQWLIELGGDVSASSRVAPVSPRNSAVVEHLRQAVSQYGDDDPRVVWLASLAVILTSPSEWEEGRAVMHARKLLQTLSPVSFENRTTSSAAHDEVRSAVSSAPEWRAPIPEPLLSVEESSAAPSLSLIDAEKLPGQATEGAGLYFLLNALKYIEIDLKRTNLPFLAHFFQQAARHAEIAADDPILLWAQVTLAENDPVQPDLRLLRIWIWQVRRWCWRNGRISLRDIVRRPGVVTLTRTDLDISMPLETADIRIRRIGLDIDPGWLPWFGRVVRFHYVERGDLHG